MVVQKIANTWEKQGLRLLLLPISSKSIRNRYCSFSWSQKKVKTCNLMSLYRHTPITLSSSTTWDHETNPKISP